MLADGTGPTFAHTAALEQRMRDAAEADGRLTWRHEVDAAWARARSESDPELLLIRLGEVSALVDGWSDEVSGRLTGR